jgi:hypothetical protein
MAIACGNDTKAPPGEGDNDSGSNGNSNSSSAGNGGSGADGGSGGSSASNNGSGTGGGVSTTGNGAGGNSSTSQVDTSTTTGAAGAGPMRVDTGLGDLCESDANCENGWTCLPPDENTYQIDEAGTLASVPGGICTKECQDAEECWEDDEWSVCIGFTSDSDAPGYCMPFCIPGDGVIECASRTDMVCNLLPTGEDGTAACQSSAECSGNQVCAGTCLGVFPVCLPNCATDAHCPQGRYCDPASGACVEEEPSGAAVGEACSDDGDCASNICVEGLCTRVCTLGVDDACGDDGACLPLLDVTIDLGDRGRCFSLCDCNSDCGNDTCLSFQDDELASNIGYDGFCGEVLTGDVELTCD